MTAGRMAQTVASAVLAVLVGVGVALSVRLWLFNPYLSPQPTNPAGYVAADAVRGLQPSDVAAPLRFVLHFGPRRSVALGDPGDSRFGALWALARPVLRSVTPAALRAARPVSLAAVAAQDQSPPASVDLDFGVTMRWSRWWSLLSGGPWPASAGPAVARMRIAPGAGATVVDLLSGTGGVSVRLPAAVGRALAGQLASLEPQPMGYSVVPLTTAVPGLTVEPGIYVPGPGFSWQALSIQPEAIDVAALAATLFPQNSVVREALQNDGSRFFTDGIDWLRVTPRGAIDYELPGEPSQPSGVPWSADIASAVEFVGRHGGWPPTAVLVGAKNRAAGGPAPASGAGSTAEAGTGHVFSFAVRVGGLPIFSSPPAVQVVVGAVGVERYRRNVPVPTASLPSIGTIPAAAALANLSQDWPASAGSGPHVVTAVVPAYRLPPAGIRLEPVWAVTVQGGSVVLVDATSGHVLGTAAAAAGAAAATGTAAATGAAGATGTAAATGTAGATGTAAATGTARG